MPGDSLLPILIASAGSVALLMFATWVWSVVRKDAGVVDVAWGLGFVVVAAVAYLLGEATGPRRLLLPAMVTLWGLRLSGFLAWRNLVVGMYPGGELNLKEDRRYGAMRRKHGERFWWVSLFTVFGLQGALLFFVSLPLQVMQAIPGRTDLAWVDYLGVLVFLGGLFFETVGDIQLLHFRLNPGSHGQVLNTGLWRYTRHPNYFGDCTAWWGMFVVALMSGMGVVATVLSPIVMTVMLLKVSGVALTERNIVERRPKYQQYIDTTSAFLPWLPRRASAAQGAVVRAKHAQV